MSCEIFKYGRSGFNNYLSFQLDERRTAPAAATLAGPHMGAQNRFPLLITRNDSKAIGETEKLLNQLGAEGWELVQIKFQEGATLNGIYYFKRSTRQVQPRKNLKR